MRKIHTIWYVIIPCPKMVTISYPFFIFFYTYDAEPCYGIKMRAADPRYITDGDDINRGDVLLTMAQVRQLITIKAQSAAEIATIWLTTADMGFSLTAESNEVTCPKDAREAFGRSHSLMSW